MEIIVTGPNTSGKTTLVSFIARALAAIGIKTTVREEDDDFQPPILPCLSAVAKKSLTRPIVVRSMTTNRSPAVSGWRGRLEFDHDVSDTSPVVKGTWVTVSHIVSLMVDGWSWTEVLRSHPELCEDDIRACLTYSLEEDGAELLARGGEDSGCVQVSP